MFAECDGPQPDGRPVDKQVQHQGVAEGTHSVLIEARLPGVERVLRSDEVEVALACGEPAAEPDRKPTAGDMDEDDDDEPAPARGDRPEQPDGSAGVGAASGQPGAGDHAAADDDDDGDDDDSRGDRTYVDNMGDEDDGNCAAVSPGGAPARTGSSLAFASALIALLALAIRRGR